jgi:hypothetical protein
MIMKNLLELSPLRDYDKGAQIYIVLTSFDLR